MTVNEYNSRILLDLLANATAFEMNELTVGEIQASIENAITLVENDGSGVAELLRGTEADLESIRFTRLQQEQRPAALARIKQFRVNLIALLA